MAGRLPAHLYTKFTFKNAGAIYQKAQNIREFLGLSDIANLRSSVVSSAK